MFYSEKTGENNLVFMLVNRSTAVHTKWGGLVFYLKEKKMWWVSDMYGVQKHQNIYTDLKVKVTLVQ